jgi:hypothetical protein
VAWRLVAAQPGRGMTRISVAEATAEKSVAIGEGMERVSPRRSSAGFVEQLWSPSEPPLAKSSPLRRIEIEYPPRELTIGLTEIPWIVAAVVLMMAFSLILGQIFGVRIA